MRLRGRAIAPLGAAAAIGLPGCAGASPVRPELVVVLDTDAPVVGQLGTHPELSRDAAVDSVRVEVLDANDAVVDVRGFLVPAPEDWPLSFGIVPAEDGAGPLRLRIRLFRAAFASAGSVHGVAVLDPRPEVTIERLAVVPRPDRGVARVEIVLSEDCIGASSSYVAPETTCVDADHLVAAPTDGIAPVGAEALESRVGTWGPARQVPCSGAARSDATCVPGGFSVLGEPLVVVPANMAGLDPVPLRPVIVSPFLLDTEEYTVGRFRALLGRTLFTGGLPLPRNSTDPSTTNFCTWLGPKNGANDALPLNCITWGAAALVCQLEGGRLPTEAEWEHAARGRGERRLYAWGDAAPTCCAASLSRQAGPEFVFDCPGEGVEPAGSHLPDPSCMAVGDVSRDGIIDLSGGLTEAVADDLFPYDSPCWTTPGVPTDPICLQQKASAHAARGANWASLLTVPLPSRFQWLDGSPSYGFRCRYPDGPP